MKRIALLILVTALLMSNFCASESDIKVFVNGYEIATDVSPVIKEGRTLLPVRAICQAIGASVSWEGETQTVTATGYDYVMVMQVGSKELKLTFDTDNDDGVKIECEVAPEIVDGRVLLPLRAMCEALDFDVSWDGDVREIKIEQRLYNMEQEDGGIMIDRTNVKVHGRYNFEKELLTSSQPASGIEIRFRGTELGLKLTPNADAYIHVFVDNNEELSFDYQDDARILLSGKEQRITLTEGLEDGIHTVKVLKANSGDSNKIAWQELYTDGEILPPPIAKERKIQIIGDSITCGSASLNFPENENGSSSGIKYQDAVLSYASCIGRMFDADVEIFARSGLSMYECIYNKETPLYDTTDCFAGIQEPWKHTNFEPDLIVQYNWINEYIGKIQRDGVSQAVIIDIYVKMLKMLTERHPNAKIVMVSRNDATEFTEILKSARREFGRKNDNVDIKNIKIITYDVSDLVNSGHPHPEGQYNIAKKLSGQIEKFMGWQAN